MYSVMLDLGFKAFKLEDASNIQARLIVMTAAVAKAFIQYYAICGMLFGCGLDLGYKWKERVHNLVSLPVNVTLAVQTLC